MASLIICDRPGRMGNLLLVYTHLAAFALEHDLTLLNPAFALYQSYFVGSQHQYVPWIARSCPSLTGEEACSQSGLYHRRLSHPLFGRLAFFIAHSALRLLRTSSLQLPPLATYISLNWDSSLDLDRTTSCHFQSMVTLLGGWLFRCNNLVAKHKTQLLLYFKPLPIYRRQAEDIVGILRAASDQALLVGVHIRLGDYRTFQEGRYLYDLNVYARYMDELRLRLNRSVSFIIVSDEIIDPAFLKLSAASFSGGSQIVDMIVLSMCDAVIGPPSTFSYFASTFWGGNHLHHITDPCQGIPDAFVNSILSSAN